MTTYSNQPHYQREPTLGDLFSDLSAQASLLVRQEVQLAKVEMSEKASQVGREIALIAVGGVLAYSALLAIAAGIILGLGLLIPYWAAALLVGLVFAIVGGALAWTGVQALKNINLAPTQTIETLKEDKEWLARQMN
jgi:uncharacterized membrane protein YqjE